jgi:hypothetical protein
MVNAVNALEVIEVAADGVTGIRGIGDETAPGEHFHSLAQQALLGVVGVDFDNHDKLLSNPARLGLWPTLKTMDGSREGPLAHL